MMRTLAHPKLVEVLLFLIWFNVWFWRGVALMGTYKHQMLWRSFNLFFVEVLQ